VTAVNTFGANGLLSRYSAAQALPQTVGPGGKIQVQMSIRLAILKPSPIDKMLWIYIRRGKWPAATIEVTGTLAPASKVRLRRTE
jgi:hypothetical protein